jgi:hypothetical protein
VTATGPVLIDRLIVATGSLSIQSARLIFTVTPAVTLPQELSFLHVPTGLITGSGFSGVPSGGVIADKSQFYRLITSQNTSANQVTVQGVNAASARLLEAALTTRPSLVAAADLDGDGPDDRVVYDRASRSLRVYRNGAITPSFVIPRRGKAFGRVVRMSAGDVTGDGRAEIIVGGVGRVAVIDGSTGNLLRQLATGSTASAARVIVVRGPLDARPQILAGVGATLRPIISRFDGPTGLLVERFRPKLPRNGLA